MNVELLYFDGCPGHAELRERLPLLLERAGVHTVIEERRIDSQGAARRERFLGSPSLRVDGLDVEPGVANRRDYAMSCRLYTAGDGLRRTPPDAWIMSALRSDARDTSRHQPAPRAEES